MTRLRLALVCALLVASFTQPASAAFHLIKVVEVFAGSTLAPDAQYVELQLYSGGQTMINGHSIFVFNAAGTGIGMTTLSGPTNTGSQDTILIATTQAETLFGVDADIVMDADLIARGGKVCFDSTPYDCVAWGNYTGSSSGVGTPFGESTGIPSGRALHRDISAGMAILEASDDTGNSAADFDLGAPTPRNNAGITGTVPASTCGNGTVEGLEDCDDDNDDDTDACKNDCTAGDVPVVCGDGDPAPSEECDDGNEIDDDACTNACTLPVCGDGITNGDDECDDDNGVDNDACTNACTLPVCGDGIANGDDECDDGNDINIDTCKNDCSDPECGDNVTSQNEQCDDGNNVDDDACSNMCELANCGDNNLDDGESCDDGNAEPGDGCTPSCQEEVCGDSLVNNNDEEDCDDGNDVDDDACRNDCTEPRCGDEIVDDGEECDDGNNIDDDECKNDCTEPAVVQPPVEVCGDDEVTESEQCDDGNTADGDGCDSDCMTESTPTEPGDEDEGCSCDTLGSNGSNGGRHLHWMALLAISALLWVRRRRVTS